MYALIIGGVLAWLGYRKDENDIELIVVGVSRGHPRLRDAYKWYESYILLAGALAMGGYTWAVLRIVIPAINIS